MDLLQKKEIVNKAEEVNRISERFQLIHATYACQSIIKDLVIESFKTEYAKLSKRIEEKMLSSRDCKEDVEEKKRLDMLIRQKSFHIDVEYIETKTDDAARVVKIENAFVIYLSKNLERNIFFEDGSYNFEVIRKIRRLMAHELGHLILHTDDLLSIDSTQGSKDIDNKKKEEEADYFGDRLLHFRKLRNEAIDKAGGSWNIY